MHVVGQLSVESIAAQAAGIRMESSQRIGVDLNPSIIIEHVGCGMGWGGVCDCFYEDQEPEAYKDRELLTNGQLAMEGNRILNVVPGDPKGLLRLYLFIKNLKKERKL